MHVRHGGPQKSLPLLAVVPGDRGEPRERLARLRAPPQEDLVVADPDVRSHEVRVDGERLLVGLDRLLEAAGLHQQLGVGIVGVGVARYQLDVLLEGLLRFGILLDEAVRVAELVVGLGEARVDGGGLGVGRDGRRIVLLSEIEAPQEIEAAGVVRVARGELRVAVPLPSHLALRPRFQPLHDEPLWFGHLAGERDRPAHRLEELLGGARGVGEPHLGQREALVLRCRRLEELARIGDSQLLREVAAFQVELPRLFRGGRDRDLVGRRCRRLRFGRRHCHETQAEQGQGAYDRSCPAFKNMHCQPP